MNALMYLAPFFTSFFAVSAILCFLVFQARTWRLPCNRKGERHQHGTDISRLGGIALILSFIVTIVVDSHLILTFSWWGIIFLSLMILIVGVWDDVRELSWKTQMLAQVCIGMGAFFFGIRLISMTFPMHGVVFFDTGMLIFVSAIVTILWIMIVMNAINWIDGIDGVCGGVSVIAFATIFLLSLYPEVNQPPIAIYSIALVGSSIGFVFFNFYPAKIIAGTSGSWFLGFMIATLAIFSGTKVATAILVLSLPLLDAIWVIFDRFQAGVSIFSSDRRHLHHRLQNIGWSLREITLLYYVVTFIMAIIALHANSYEKVGALACVFIIVCIFFMWIRWKSQKKDIIPGGK